MERWSGRVALVTGASAGIGEAIAKELVLKGMKVVGVARRVERVEALNAGLREAPGKLYPLKCDITQESDILVVFEWVKKNLGGVDVLINNAGVFCGVNLYDGKTEDMRHIFDVNVIGLSICTREALKSMKERGVDDGHIIHINSIAGHRVGNYPQVSMYSASKHAVTALTEGLRNELNFLKTHIKITSISPGLVRTEIGQKEDPDMTPEGRAAMLARTQFFASQPILEPQDIADAVVYTLGTPAHVQIHELTIKPVGEAS